MRKSHCRRAVGAASVVMALVGHGVAGADAMSDVTGKYYGQAKEVLSSAGLTPIVATRVGDYWSATTDCVIDRIQRADVARSAGASASSTVYVHLNCYAQRASSQQAGYSRQSQTRPCRVRSSAAGSRTSTRPKQKPSSRPQSEENITAENQLLRRRLGRSRCAQQHVDAVVDELLAGGGQPAVQIGGEQRGQRADQAGGHHVLQRPDR